MTLLKGRIFHQGKSSIKSFYLAFDSLIYNPNLTNFFRTGDLTTQKNVTVGHSRQGWKCRLCKINVHSDCRSGVSRCLPKSRLLRRQKSSSELDSSMVSDNLPDDDLVSNAEEIDQTYSVLKQVRSVYDAMSCM